MNYFNDSPIDSPEDDYFGISTFSETLAHGIAEIQDPVGTVIALHGPWGSGKSSAVNLVKKQLDSKHKDIRIVNFACWWYRGEEALALAFLQNLNSAFTLEFGDKVKELVPKIARNVLQAGPVIASAISMSTTGKPWSGLTEASLDYVKKFFPDGDSLENTYKKLTEFLSNQDTRFLVVIDDIDRLVPEEAMAVFRTVKSVGRLPNVQYLLVFDRSLAEKNASEMFPSEGPHFLEKIIQISFEIPPPLRSDLINAALGVVHQICGPVSEGDTRHLMNLFYDIIAPSIETPRDITRYRSSLSLTWPTIKKDVCLGDYTAIEMIRLKHPELHTNIKINKDIFCNNRSETNVDDALINSRLLKGIAEEKKEFARRCFDRLFPNWKSRSYSGGYEQSWAQNKMVCSQRHFDTYFRLSISDENMGGELLEEIISRANDKDYIQSVFRNAAKIRRNDGTSLVPVYLDEISTNSNRFTNDQAFGILEALYEIHDEIDLEVDSEKGMMGFANTSRRFTWLTGSLLTKNLSIEERSEKILSLSDGCSIGWLAELARFSLAEYEESDDESTRSHEPLFTEECAIELGKKALHEIVEASKSDEMIYHRDLGSLIHMWYRLDSSTPKNVTLWTSQQIEDDVKAIALAKAFTGESWGQGLSGGGGLDDRVSMREFRVDLNNDSVYVDFEKLKAKITVIVDSQNLPDESIQVGRNFLHGIANSQNNPF